MSEILIDTIVFEPRVLENSDDGIMRIEGVFQRSDTKNANGRVYPRKLWERLLSSGTKVATRIKERAMIGHLEHPADGVTDLRKGAILITKLGLDEKGQVLGQAEILNTPDGNIVQEYVDKNVRIGISSRGKGSVGANGVVAEDYDLETFDVVYNPSTLKAHPRRVSEEDENLDPVPGIQEEEEEELTMSVNEATQHLRTIESRVKMLVEQDVTGLPTFQLSDLEGKLLESSVQLGDLAVNTPALAGVADGLQNRINEKREEISSVLAGGKATTGTSIEDDGLSEEELEQIENLLDEDEDHEEYVEQVDSILEATSDQMEEKLDQLDASAELFEAMRGRLSEAEEYAEVLEEKLSAAVALISALTGRSQDAEIEEAVEVVLESNPRLGSVASVLVECASVEEVFEKAGMLSEAIGEENESDEDESDEDESDEDESDEDEDLDLADTDDEDEDEDDFEESFSGSNNLFEDIDDLDEDLESEEDVSTGLIESTREAAASNHKGHKLAAAAIKRL